MDYRNRFPYISSSIYRHIFLLSVCSGRGFLTILKQTGTGRFRSSIHQSFIYSPTDALVSCLKNNIKIYIKIYIKTAPTCYGVTVTPSSGIALICAY